MSKLIEMYQAKQNMNSLDGLTDSATSVWDEPYKIVSVILDNYEALINSILNEFDAKMRNFITGVVEYYGNIALNFQYGYQTVFNKETNRAEYPLIDEDAKIVKFSSAERTPNGILVKVLKENTFLDNAEKEALSRYFNGDIFGREGVSFAGTQVTIVSQSGDTLILNARIQINPAIVDINGMNILTGNNDFINTITDFLRSYQTEQFNSTLYIPQLVDIIQNINGVKNRNVKITSCIATPFGSVNSIDITQTENQSYNPYSGYFEIHPNYSLADTLIFYV